MTRYDDDGSDERRRNKLCRNKRDGMIAGVCAGFADYFGFDIGMTRVVVVIAAFIFPMLVLVYFVLRSSSRQRRRDSSRMPKGKQASVGACVPSRMRR